MSFVLWRYIAVICFASFNMLHLACHLSFTAAYQNVTLAHLEQGSDSVPISHTEHDRCVQDVQELKWHVSYDTRQLARFQSNLDTIGRLRPAKTPVLLLFVIIIYSFKE